MVIRQFIFIGIMGWLIILFSAKFIVAQNLVIIADSIRIKNRIPELAYTIVKANTIVSPSASVGGAAYSITGSLLFTN
jgi:hypothetical protein